MSVNPRTKEKEEINNICSFKDSSIFNLEFSVDNCIQFLYISYFLKGKGKYDIYYTGFMRRLFYVHLN